MAYLGGRMKCCWHPRSATCNSEITVDYFLKPRHPFTAKSPNAPVAAQLSILKWHGFIK